MLNVGGPPDGSRVRRGQGVVHGPPCNSISSKVHAHVSDTSLLAGMLPTVPSSDICDSSCSAAQSVAQIFCRTWSNFEPATWNNVPGSIDLRADGSGTLSSPFTMHTRTLGPLEAVISHDFTWRLRTDGPIKLVDSRAPVYGTMAKLIASKRAWTFEPWKSNHMFIPAYIHVELAGEGSRQSRTWYEAHSGFGNLTIDAAAKPGAHLPIEIIEFILDIAILDDTATHLLYTSRWVRERFLSKRRRDKFTRIAQRIQKWGIVSAYIYLSASVISPDLWGFRLSG